MEEQILVVMVPVIPRYIGPRFLRKQQSEGSRLVVANMAVAANCWVTKLHRTCQSDPEK